MNSAEALPASIRPVEIRRKTTANLKELQRAQLTMSGSWRIDLDWNGPAGKGSALLDGQVQ
jgi:hypothetical protein